MIDTMNHPQTMTTLGREDRATLRSDPSARADAGTWIGGIAHCVAPLFPYIHYQPQSDKPNFPLPTGLPFGTILWATGGCAPKSNGHKGLSYSGEKCRLEDQPCSTRWLSGNYSLFERSADSVVNKLGRDSRH